MHDGRFIQPDTVVPDAKNLQAYNRYTYVNNNPLKYVDPTGHFAWFAFIGAILVGALIGGGTAAAFGGNIWVGALQGAATGAIFFGAGQAIHAANVAAQAAGKAGISIAAQVSIHAAAGAVSGVINSAIAGGGLDQIGRAALVGGITGAAGKLVGGFLGDERFFVQLFGRSMTGAATGATAMAIMGGDPLTGAWQGAAIAGAGSVFNDLWHDKVMPYLRGVFQGSRVVPGVGAKYKLKIGPLLKAEGGLHFVHGNRVGLEGFEGFSEDYIGVSFEALGHELSAQSVNGNTQLGYSYNNISSDFVIEFGGTYPFAFPFAVNAELHINLTEAWPF